MKLLGIDYGLKRIGLAFSQTSLAEPLAVVRLSDKDRLARQNNLLLKKIFSLCQKHQVEKIIVGLPEGKMAVRAKQFGKKLSAFTKLPVVFQDETLTTQEAVDKMIQAGKRQKARQEKKDAVAAALILQNYLDSNV